MRHSFSPDENDGIASVDRNSARVPALVFHCEARLAVCWGGETVERGRSWFVLEGKQSAATVDYDNLRYDTDKKAL